MKLRALVIDQRPFLLIDLTDFIQPNTPFIRIGAKN
jgi:hypothetical protein